MHAKRKGCTAVLHQHWSRTGKVCTFYDSIEECQIQRGNSPFSHKALEQKGYPSIPRFFFNVHLNFDNCYYFKVVDGSVEIHFKFLHCALKSMKTLIRNFFIMCATLLMILKSSLDILTLAFLSFFLVIQVTWSLHLWKFGLILLPERIRGKFV